MQLNRKTRRSLRAKNKRNRKANKARALQYVETKDGKTKKIHHFRKDKTILSSFDLPKVIDNPPHITTNI